MTRSYENKNFSKLLIINTVLLLEEKDSSLNWLTRADKRIPYNFQS